MPIKDVPLTAAFALPEDELFPLIKTHPSQEDIWKHLYHLAWTGAGGVKTNPLVAAALVSKEGRFIHSAAHLIWGKEHAEALLVKEAKELFGENILKEASLYCTLEPCAHEAKTPSCAKMLAALPLKEVTYAQKDPNPLVCGQGEALLKKAGIEVKRAPDNLQIPFEKLTERFIQGLRLGAKPSRPFIGLKSAATENGLIGLADKGRFSISCQRSLNYGHFLRRVYDAILIGPKTLLLDQPSLTAREKGAPYHTPLRIVFDPQGFALSSLIKNKLPCPLLEEFPDKTLWLLSEEVFKKNPQWLSFLETKAVAFYLLKDLSDDEGINQSLHDFLSWLLIEKSITSLLLEGGRSVWELFLNHALVDRLHLFLCQTKENTLKEDGIFWPKFLDLKEKIEKQNLVYRLDQDLLWDGLL